MSDEDLIRRGDALDAIYTQHPEWTADAVAAIPAVQTFTAADLSDPTVIHANMLRGTIAKPTMEQVIHLYGVDALVKALAPVIVHEAQVSETPKSEHVASDMLSPEVQRMIREAEARAEAAEAENAQLREVLEQMREGWENVLELDLIPDRHRWAARVLADAARAALQPAPTVTAGWPTEEGEGSIIVGKAKGDSHE